MSLGTCPSSYITGESESLLEEYAARRRFGDMEVTDLSARQVDAFLVLESEFSAEVKYVEQHARPNTRDIR